uniref:Coenzyme q (Ubiquinone) biosynthesis protein coq4 protein n=1 Tax=Toxoplasma gondii COUG TaxID=1074873 RepID=A0A2G8XN11_TOXGO|nr:coenzyme q (ubiquinone) biosynthesis protein coq4 protein [Toxoplasma gondii COUG]
MQSKVFPKKEKPGKVGLVVLSRGEERLRLLCRDCRRVAASVEWISVFLFLQLHDIMHTLYGMNISVEAEVALKLIEFHNTGLPMTLLGSIFGPLAAPIIRMHMPRRATDADVVGEALAGKLRRERSGEESCSFTSVNAPLHIVYESEQTRQQGEKSEAESGVFPEEDRTVSEERSDTEVLYPRHALLTELLPWAWKAGRAVKVPLHCVYVEEWFDRPLEDLRRHCGVILPPAHLAPHVARDQSS